eukprot:gene33417-56040_t
MGLSPLLVEQMFEIIERLHREQKITILLVEQNVQLALAVSSYGYILENGEISLHGPAAQLANDEAVRRVKTMLSLNNLVVQRGGKHVLHGVSLQVVPGQITALVGANGAGKSSLVMALAGALPLVSGHIELDGV